MSLEKTVQFIKYVYRRLTLDRIRCLFAGSLAKLVHIFIYRGKTKDLWVFGSGSGYFDNNIKTFYEYCSDKSINCQTRPKEFTFISKLNQDSIPIKSIRKGTFKAYLEAFRASVLIFDTGNQDIIPGFIRFSKALKVNVSHGQEGFKTLPSNYYKRIDADIHCAVSEFERNIKIKFCGAKANNVYVVGQPRYDNSSFPNLDGDVLLFFTWREGLQYLTPEQVLQTDYIRNIKELLFSKELHDTLVAVNRNLKVKLHHMLPQLDFNLRSPRISFISEEENFTDIIKSSCLLITDYSSVAWDFIYNGRPVIFYPFDIENYSVNPGLYINPVEADEFLSSRTVTELLVNIESVLGEDKQVVSKSKYFSFDDNKNCERLFKLIDEQREKK